MDFPENYSETVENEIICRIQNGDTELFSIISNRYLEHINYLISSINDSEVDREDLVQEGLLALYFAVSVYDFSSASFNTFATVCIKRSLISAIRRGCAKKRIPKNLFDSLDDFNDLKSNEFGPEDVIINKESFVYFLDKIKLKLSSFEYSVLVSYLKYGNYRDVSKNLSVPVKNIDNALQRIRKKIGKINR